ncbi:hypothetical protein [uncultured Sphingorhabdus sp.]|uniref:hypothetical protein n=1 Tax=uncultured Sphingorhabdus sp. TaxID=1686106 RepID=UPI002621E12F|nr:hypothetical protein [uncultured Sphingorhabdus sp.]
MAIFGFSEFLTALALLILVFTSSDFLYHFRISIAAIPLIWLSFISTLIIGIGTLLTDLWFAERWYAIPWGISRSVLQASFGALFLMTVLLWIWFAFIRPPIFGRLNSKRFHSAFFRAIVRGSDSQLAVLGSEIMRSANTLISTSNARRQGKGSEVSIGAPEYAHDVLLLLGNRKLCRHIVASSPVTAIVLMDEAARQQKFHVPLGGFAKNITTEAIINRDSILYHEDTYGSDILGWVQPFSNAMYGNYRLVEGLSVGMDSPLDLPWRVSWDMDGDQFEAYCRITLITFKNYIESGLYGGHSYALNRAFDVIKNAGRELYKINGQPMDATDRDPAKRLSAAAHFVRDVINFLGEKKELKFGKLRIPPKGSAGYHANIFDHIADMMYDLLLAASSVRSSPDNAWSIHYGTVWTNFFGFREKSEAWNAIRFKFSRLVFDEIKKLEKFPNYEGSRILGICLNIFGTEIRDKTSYDRGEYRLIKAVLEWTRKNYLWLSEAHPPVAKNCLMGSITFDPKHRRLVKTYAQGLNLTPSQTFLELEMPKPEMLKRQID